MNCLRGPIPIPGWILKTSPKIDFPFLHTNTTLLYLKFKKKVPSGVVYVCERERESNTGIFRLFKDSKWEKTASKEVEVKKSVYAWMNLQGAEERGCSDDLVWSVCGRSYLTPHKYRFWLLHIYLTHIFCHSFWTINLAKRKKIQNLTLLKFTHQNPFISIKFTKWGKNK